MKTRTQPITFTLERYYAGPEVEEPVLIWESTLKMRGGLDRSAETVPHPVWDSDEMAAEVIRSTMRMFADDWPWEYVQADGRLMLPPRDVFYEALQRKTPHGVHEESRLVDAIQFYLANFYPQRPPIELLNADTYDRAAYILREHQV
jgi:hypothetical protein